LKPENILLDATGHVALCDFGLSKADLHPDELTTTFCGTTEYLAPEILLSEQGYSKIVDFLVPGGAAVRNVLRLESFLC
jgi:serine/threonine protein kinase